MKYDQAMVFSMEIPQNKLNSMSPIFLMLLGKEKYKLTLLHWHDGKYELMMGHTYIFWISRGNFLGYCTFFS